MNFDFTKEQKMLQQSVREYIKDCPCFSPSIAQSLIGFGMLFPFERNGTYFFFLS